MEDTYDGLSPGTVISELELKKRNPIIYNLSFGWQPMAEVAPDGSRLGRIVLIDPLTMRRFRNIVVPASAWEPTQKPEYANEFPMQACIPLDRVTPASFAFVGFYPGGSFSPDCSEVGGGVLIYARAAPGTNTVIKEVVLWG